MVSYSYNERIGFGMFFHKLKQIGVLDRYIKNYMKYHRVKSPLRIPEVMFSEHNLQFFGLSFEPMLKKKQEPSNSGPILLYNLLCRRFGNIGISFPWEMTPEGYNYWLQVEEQLRKR